MYFSRNTAGECEIGFHSKNSNKYKHKLRITAFRKQGLGCDQMPPGEINDIPRSARLHLEVNQPDVINGVQFFQPPLTSGTLHDNDFRWVINLEGSPGITPI